MLLPRLCHPIVRPAKSPTLTLLIRGLIANPERNVSPAAGPTGTVGPTIKPEPPQEAVPDLRAAHQQGSAYSDELHNKIKVSHRTRADHSGLNLAHSHRTC